MKTEAPSKDTVRVEHTPTPWRTRQNDSEAPDDMIIMAGDGESICDCAPGNPYMSSKTAKANAAFIVRAVNAHDSAVRSLQIAIEHIEHMAAFITKQNAGYSFESLGEDMPGIHATLSRLKSEG